METTFFSPFLSLVFFFLFCCASFNVASILRKVLFLRVFYSLLYYADYCFLGAGVWSLLWGSDTSQKPTGLADSLVKGKGA